jgi:polysaccharide pyruvyl transferase WcaK-like protein
MSVQRIVLYGLFGIGNFGNDTTFEAVLHNLRNIQPSADITCVCGGHQFIAERFGIKTLPYDVGMSRRVNLPSSRALQVAAQGALRVADEIEFWLRRPLWFRSIDQFIVVGTGAVTEMTVRPWNAPYDLFKWCTAAKLGGARLTFLSVGAGPIENRLSRTLMLSALRLADYRSYRDAPSVEYARGVGFDTTDDGVYPDLVFSLPEKGWSAPHRASAKPRTVGLGVMGYYGCRYAQSSGESIFQGYMAKLKRFVHWLLDQRYSIRLLIGHSGVDQRPIDELLDFVQTTGPSDWQDRVFAEPIGDVYDLFQQIADTDVVVATRFHNIVCALMMGRPAVSIGYHPKNDALMADMGLEAYCQHIEHFDIERLIQQFQSLTSELDPASQRIQQKCVEYRQLLDEQYRRILCLEAADARAIDPNRGRKE